MSNILAILIEQPYSYLWNVTLISRLTLCVELTIVLYRCDLKTNAQLKKAPMNP